MHEWVYFVGDDKCIRIGYTEDLIKRLDTHSRYGLKAFAIIPSEERHEKALHDFFAPHLLDARDSSTYSKGDVMPFVERLLQFGYATDSPEHALTWACPDWQAWRPDKILNPLWEGKQQALFVTDGIKADIRDCYETPENVLRHCREALGGSIDLDPCSNSVANQRVRAKHFYDEKMNGLIRPWVGTVFLNPPYGGRKIPKAKKFINKLLGEIEVGNVTAVVTVINLQSWPTKWFPLLGDVAVLHGVWKSRIDFIRPRKPNGSKPRASSKNGTVFSYWGPRPDLFWAAFKDVADIVRPIRSIEEAMIH
jgi:hypothetical protein